MERFIISIHDKVNISIESKYGFYRKHLREEYPDFFFVDSPEGPVDIKLYIDTVFPQKQEGDIFLKERFKGVHRYECLIRNIEGDVKEIYYRTYPLARFAYPSMAAVFLQAELLEPIIYLKALENGLLMVHASGVFDEKGGYLFAAEAGVGKTTTAFHLTNKGFGFLGDDLVFVSGERKLYSYPKAVHFFSYLKSKNPFLVISVKMMVFSKIRLFIRNILRVLTGKEFYFSSRISIKDIMPSAEIGKVVPFEGLLIMKNAAHKENVQATSLEELRSDIIETCDTRKSLFDNLLTDKGDLIRGILEKESNIISGVWDKLPYREIFIKDITEETVRIMQIVKGGI